MVIAEQIRANQDVKEMSRRAIETLIAIGGYTADLEQEFFQTYHERIRKEV